MPNSKIVAAIRIASRKYQTAKGEEAKRPQISAESVPRGPWVTERTKYRRHHPDVTQ